MHGSCIAWDLLPLRMAEPNWCKVDGQGPIFPFPIEIFTDKSTQALLNWEKSQIQPSANVGRLMIPQAASYLGA